jgi:hypothetical protein
VFATYRIVMGGGDGGKACLLFLDFFFFYEYILTGFVKLPYHRS